MTDLPNLLVICVPEFYPVPDTYSWTAKAPTLVREAVPADWDAHTTSGARVKQ